MGVHSQPVVIVQQGHDTLSIDLADGRTLSLPLAWYPRLSHGSSEERNHWRFIAAGRGIHWPDLDEDISVENLLAGKASGESQASLKKWLEQRLGKKSQQLPTIKKAAKIRLTKEISAGYIT